MTLGTALAGRNNALNLVRVLLAAAVIVSHTWPLGGFGEDPTLGGMSVGTWAVSGFFGISGYLICASRARLDLRSFAAARALRIFPGYWGAQVAVAVLFAPGAAIVTGTSLDVRGAAWYVLSNATTRPVTPGFGAAIHHAAWPFGDWNGAVWTLQYELLCYVLVGAAFCLRRVRTDATLFTAGALTMLTALNCLSSSIGGHGRGVSMLSDFLRMGAYFAAGALLWALRDKIRVDVKVAGGAALSLVVVTALGRVDDVGALPLAYLVLCAGARCPVRWGQRTDLSYGVYVYGWPIQSVLSLAGAKALGPAGFAGVALVVAGGFAALSWRLVERPALRLRSRNDETRPSHPKVREARRVESGMRVGRVVRAQEDAHEGQARPGDEQGDHAAQEPPVPVRAGHLIEPSRAT